MSIIFQNCYHYNDVKKIVIRNIFVISIIFLIVFLVSANEEYIRRKAISLLGDGTSQVRGASTEKGEEVSGKISSDIGDQMSLIKDDLLDIRIGDIMDGLSRARKISHDLSQVSIYIRDKVDGVLQSDK